MRTIWQTVILGLLLTGMALTALAGQPDADGLAEKQLLFSLTSSDRAEREAALEGMAYSGNPHFDAVFEAYRTGYLYRFGDDIVLGLETVMDDDLNEFIVAGDVFTGKPLLDAQGKKTLLPVEEVENLTPGRKERKLVARYAVILNLASPDAEKRLTSVRKATGDEAPRDLLADLDRMAGQDADSQVRRAAGESAAIIRFKQPQSLTEELEAAAVLGDLGSMRGKSSLVKRLKDESLSADHREHLQDAVDDILFHEKMVQVFEIVKSGVSSGSILALMALGLAITFGLMGVINMAHGEMMMVGAYAAYCMQLFFGHTPDHPADYFYLFALPFSFLAAALAGGVIEWVVVRRLYKRPLESLLATYGVGMVMIQTVRLIFGDNRPSSSPVWLQGGFEIAPDMLVPYNRLFILVLCLACVVAVYLLMNKTSLGLKMRGVMQNRDMAAAMGVNTRLVDSCVFMLGSGFAGIAGCALTVIGGITPDMGQNYIVDSFLVVVTGGVGSLAGVVYNGFGLGIINKLLEGTIFGAVWAKIIVLIIVIAFIQYRPSGLFAPKGRLADDN